MKSFLALALFVGAALGSGSTAFFGWTPNHELVYQFETEVSELHGDQNSGIQLTSEVLIQTRRDYSLMVKFVDPKFIHTAGERTMPEDRHEVPEHLRSHLTKPFLVHLKRGIVERFFVEESEPVVVTNIKKSLLAQVQLDLTASRQSELLNTNMINTDSDISNENLKGKTFFTTEETSLNGDCPTDYNMFPLSKSQSRSLRSKSFGAKVCKGKQFWTIVKTESFENCRRYPTVAACDSSKTECKYPTSSTKYTVCGTSERFTICEIVSQSNGLLNPLSINKERTINTARVALFLKAKSSGFTPLSVSEQGKEMTSLIMESPLTYEWSHFSTIKTNTENPSEVLTPLRPVPGRHSPDNLYPSSMTHSEIKSQAIQGMMEIVEFINSPSESMGSDVIGKINALVVELRYLNFEELRSLHSEMEAILSHEQQMKKVIGKNVLQMVLASVGSNPAVTLMKEEIESGNVSSKNLSNVVKTLIRDVRTPTKEILGDLVQLVKSLKHSGPSTVYHSALNQLSTLFYRACVDYKTSISDFPVKVYGHFCTKDSSILVDEYIPHLTSELKHIDVESRKQCMALISALGKTGHKEALNPIANAIEKHFSERTIKRSLAVYGLRHISMQEPTLARAVISKLLAKHDEETSMHSGQGSAVVPVMLKNVTDEHERKERRDSVKHQQDTYKLMPQDAPERNIPRIPFLKNLPIQESPSKKWMVMVLDFVIINFSLPPPLKAFLAQVEKHITNKPGCVLATIQWLKAALISDKKPTPSSMKHIIEEIDAKCKIQLLQEYEDYDIDDLIPGAISSLLNEGPDDIGKEEIEMNAAFARYRLAGPNPIKLEHCTEELKDKVALKNAPVKVKDAVEKAFKEGRLFALDYTMLASFNSTIITKSMVSEMDDAKRQKFSMGPITLFEIPTCPERRQREYLVPLCIQCEPWNKVNQTSGPVIFTPEDGVAWKVARTIVQSVDADYHEGVVHLGMTHLVQEAFMLSTKRMFPHNHPLFILLKPHFEGTAFINYAANKALVNPSGAVDQLASQDEHERNGLIGDMVMAQLSKNITFPAMLQERKMDWDNFKTPYPYRDDGILIWNALESWVSAYVDVYYPTNNDVKEDPELQAWIEDLINNSNITWLQKWDNTTAFLKDTLTTTIWTGSAQHAAVNFPQKKLMSYTPTFPLGLYDDVPTDKYQTLNDYYSLLPPPNMDMKQSAITKLLGGIYYTRLGKYNDKGYDYFEDERVHKPLQKLQEDLAQAEEKIKKRNEERFNLAKKVWGEKKAQGWKYEYLLPTRIPQSVNI